MDPDLERKNNDHLRPFWKILDFVVNHNSHLLDEHDQFAVQTFLSLTEYAKFLFVRMFDRNYATTDTQQVREKNILGYMGDSVLLKDAVAELVDRKMMVKIQQDDLPTVLAALTAVELKSIILAMKLPMPQNKRRDGLIKSLLKAVETGTSQKTIGSTTLATSLVAYIKKCHGGTHTLAKQPVDTFNKIYQIYYYDSGYEDMATCFSRLYFQCIGLRQYFQYKLNPKPLFRSIDEFQEYQEALAQDLYWNDDNRQLRLEDAEPVVKRLDEVLAKVTRAVDQITNVDEGRFNAKYVWMRVAVRIGNTPVTGLGKGEKTSLLLRRWKFLEQFFRQSVYAQHKVIPAVSVKIHVGTELYKATNLWEWMSKTHSDVKFAMTKARQEAILDPAILDLDKKIKAFQAAFNKRYNKWVESGKKEKKKTDMGLIPQKVAYKPLSPKLSMVEENVVVGNIKPVDAPFGGEEEDKAASPQREPKTKQPKQSSISEFFGANGAIKRPKKVHNVVIFDSDSEDDSDMVTEVRQPQDAQEEPKELDINVDSLIKAVRIQGPTEWSSEVDSRTIRVEDVALEHYAKSGWRGWHNEGASLRGIFTLLFWDIVFMEEVDGVFYNHCQSAPLDMFTKEFYTRRKRAIDQRLDELNSLEFIESKLRDVHAAVTSSKWDRTANCYKTVGPLAVGVNFDRLGLDDYVTAARYLGAHAVRGICRLLARDYYRYDSGMPDLCLVNDDTGVCKLVEVKSKNDSLSDTQRVWIHHLVQLGVDVDLCRVLTHDQYDEWADDMPKRNASKSRLNFNVKRKRM